MQATLARNATTVKPAARIVFDSADVGRLRNPAFGKGLVVARAATVEEARAHHLEATYSAAEMGFARRSGMTLREAREVLAGFDACCEERVIEDDDASTAALVAAYDPTDYAATIGEAEPIAPAAPAPAAVASAPRRKGVDAGKARRLAVAR